VPDPARPHRLRPGLRRAADRPDEEEAMRKPERIRQAVILAAGFGSRMRPLTDTLPKAMVPVAGRPLLERHVERLRAHGIEEIFINLHYLPEVIRSHFGDGSRWGVRIDYELEPQIRGTAGGVKGF